MVSVAASSDQPIVSRADNRRKLEQIDADVATALKAMIRSEEQERHLSSKIVCAGVQMLAIQRSDPDAWQAFKKTDKQANKIACKGKNWVYREVATVLWKGHRASPSRERISIYGKAIKIAHEAYWAAGTAKPTEILTHIISAGGVKGLLKIAKVPKGATKPKRIILDRPTILTVVVLRPDGTHGTVPAEIARRILIETGELQ